MDVYDAINQRRSVREFIKDKPVPREVLHRIATAGLEAPSGCNMQTRQFVIIDEPTVLDAIRPHSKMLETATAAVVILADPIPTPYGEFWVQDVSAAMENMLLAATAEGLGGCWLEGGLRRFDAELAALLGVPEPLKVWSMAVLGYPAVNPPRPPRLDEDEAIHVNHYSIQE